MPVHSIIALYNRRDAEQGEFCQAFDTPTEADAIEACRSVMAENSGNKPGTAEIVEIIPGVNIWEAAELLSVCKKLLTCYCEVTGRDPVSGADASGQVDPIIVVAAKAIAAAESE